MSASHIFLIIVDLHSLSFSLNLKGFIILTQYLILGDLFKGISETGCWMCLQYVDALRPSVLSVAGQLAAEVHQALMAGRSAITIMSEEVVLSPHAACFVTFNSAPIINNPPNPLNNIANSIPAPLPKEFIDNFR